MSPALPLVRRRSCHPRLWVAALLLALGAAAQEYTGKYLYAEPQASDPGSLEVTVTETSPALTVVVAVGQQGRQPYLAERLGPLAWRFPHLPVDKYDLLLVAADRFYEGVRLVPQANPAPPAAELTAIAAEVAKIEGFFDAKQVHRTDVQDTEAGVLLQQWREKQALKQSGEVVKGHIHSLDLIWFAKPLTGWQLVTRRQVYRQELPQPVPLRHLHLPDLGGIRVVTSPKRVGPLALP